MNVVDVRAVTAITEVSRSTLSLFTVYTHLLLTFSLWRPIICGLSDAGILFLFMCTENELNFFQTANSGVRKASNTACAGRGINRARIPDHTTTRRGAGQGAEPAQLEGAARHSLKEQHGTT